MNAPHPLLHHFSAAPVVVNRPLPDNQGLLVLEAPVLAELARPGHFVHLAVGPGFTLRRPFSIFEAEPWRGTLSILYKVVGEGTAMMAQWRAGERVDLLGPIGRPFRQPEAGARAVLMGGGVGFAPLNFLAGQLVAGGVETLLFQGTEGDSPFPLAATLRGVAGVDGAVDRALARLEQLNVASRLASLQRRPGWFTGYVTDLAAAHLDALSAGELARTHLYLCGPPAMLKAGAVLARRLGLGGEASLEAHMACGFGGCAGCVVPIRTGTDPEDWTWRRVCVDGPVFPIDQVDWDRW